MINKTDFEKWLKAMAFSPRTDGVHAKSIDGYIVEVDFSRERINYGLDITIGDRTTSNFSQPENLVVLECVCRLLEKGYAPGDLTIEKRWKLGRTAKGGKADIVVRGKDKKTLLILECKTWGAEFDKERQRMQNSKGGQLFSYLQQDKNTKYLCLYAARLNDDGEVDYRNAIVKIEDRQEDIADYRKGDQSIKLYRDANTADELHDVWKDRFNLYFHYNGIFEYDVNAYEIELKPLKKKDLLPFPEAENVFNQFAEILRHNNISDNANAFNRILSLLLCKMVDEEKSDDEVLDFQVKEGEDTPEKIHDRLQKLYQTGMKQYLRENVVYHSDAEIEKIIKLYPRQTPLEKIESIFRDIKYYTNNEFAFKEVHNKELFEQNSRVLNEVIKMLQNYRFKYTKKKQILGDFFELLLNHGVKQSEGQFFTPVPIVRFILLSIGLERIVEQKLKKKELNFLPRILDYACGSGHFLTESIDELQKYLNVMRARTNGQTARQKTINRNIKRYQESTEWAKDYIFGIEKDYRLARTSQIACFINGDGDANVIFGDGLEKHDRLKPASKFDLVVANPPYSVKAFKNHLRITKNDYSLYEHLTEAAREIETLFIERTAQVLVVGGMAGIILPSTILSNAGIYTKAREILLKKFEIKCIAEFGSKTFIATGTQTVILFLRRRSDDFAKDRKYIAEDFFAGKTRPKKKDYIDSQKLLAQFVDQKRQVALADYQTLIQKNPSAAIRKTEWFEDYTNRFTDDLQMILDQEEEKFYFYMLCLNDADESQCVVAVNSGNSTDEQKTFLGYQFSGRRGSEGIKMFTDENNKYNGKLYDDSNHISSKKANSYILRNLWGEKFGDIATELRSHIKQVRLIDCLDFSRIKFEKTINVKIAEQVDIKSRWDTVSLSECCDFQNGLWKGKKQPFKRVKVLRNTEFLPNGTLNYGRTLEINVETKELDKRDLSYGDILLEKSGGSPTQPIGRVAFFDKKGEYSFGNFIARIRPKNKAKLNVHYLWNYLHFFYLQGGTKPFEHGVRIMNLDFEGYNKIKIPLPPIDVQKTIVTECETIDEQAEKAEQEITSLQKEINENLEKILTEENNLKAIGELTKIESGGTPSTKIRQYWDNGNICWATLVDTKEKYLYATQKKITSIGLEKSSAKLLPINTVLFSSRATIGDVSIAKTETCTNQGYKNFICDEQQLHHEFLYYVLKRNAKDIEKLASGMTYPEVSKTALANYRIPLPSINEQKQIASQLAKKDRHIAELHTKINSAQERKNAILKKHL